jgi:hypothetical protein
MTSFSVQVAAEKRVPRSELKQVEQDLTLFLELRERLARKELSLLRHELGQVLSEADDVGVDPSAPHPATGEAVGSREERALLAFQSLVDFFTSRRKLLGETITAPQVAEILGISRQAVAARAAKGSLLAVLDRGAFRFPTFQFDPRGPDGLVEGLAEVLNALEPQPAFTKLVWLTRANDTLDGAEPLEVLRRGERARVVAAARAAAQLP